MASAAGVPQDAAGEGESAVAVVAEAPALAQPIPTAVAGAAASGAPAALPTTPAALDPLATSTGEQVRPALTELARGLRDEGGTASLVVRLDPPELGPVLVRLTVVDGRVDVTLRAPEAEAARGLALTSSEVARVLAEHGLDLSSFDVDTGALPWAGGDRQDRASTGERDGSTGRGTPGRGNGADDNGDAPRVRVTDDAPADGSAGSGSTWL